MRRKAFCEDSRVMQSRDYRSHTDEVLWLWRISFRGLAISSFSSELLLLKTFNACAKFSFRLIIFNKVKIPTRSQHELILHI